MKTMAGLAVEAYHNRGADEDAADQDAANVAMVKVNDKLREMFGNKFDEIDFPAVTVARGILSDFGYNSIIIEGCVDLGDGIRSGFSVVIADESYYRNGMVSFAVIARCPHCKASISYVWADPVSLGRILSGDAVCHYCVQGIGASGLLKGGKFAGGENVTL